MLFGEGEGGERVERERGGGEGGYIEYDGYLDLI